MPLPKPPSIESARLHIRLVAESDLPALFEINGDPEVTKFLPSTWNSMQDARAWFERMLEIHDSGLGLQFAIADRLTGKVIGTCMLFDFDEPNACAELGYILARAHWGRGYMLEALTAFLDAAFTHMSLRRLGAHIDPLNTPSARILERLGFTREGLLRQRWVTNGVIGDAAAYGLLQHEWPGSAAQARDLQPSVTSA